MAATPQHTTPNPPIDMQCVRWYVLTLPEMHRGGARGLEEEKKHRRQEGDMDFDYFAPVCRTAKRVGGRITVTSRPLYFTYVFVHASIRTIMNMKRTLPAYNLLPVVRSRSEAHYPYLTDETMRTLSWVARSYSTTLPVYTPTGADIVTGDRVRVTSGQFEGVTASVVASGRHKDVMVRIEDLFYIPLINLRPEEFEIIELATSKHTYNCLGDKKLQKSLLEAVCRHAQGGTTPADRQLAIDTLQKFAAIENLPTDIMRTNLYAFLLPAHRILDNDAQLASMVENVAALATTIRAPQSQALLYLILYAVTDDFLFCRQAHALIDPMAGTGTLTPLKRLLIDSLHALDQAYTH